MARGYKIAAARKKQNLTQEQLADLLSVSRQSVSKWESDISLPEMDKVVKLCKILDINCDYLLKDNTDESGREIINVSMNKPEENASDRSGISGGARVFCIFFITIGLIITTIGLVAEILMMTVAQSAAGLMPQWFIVLGVGLALYLVGQITYFVLNKRG